MPDIYLTCFRYMPGHMMSSDLLLQREGAIMDEIQSSPSNQTHMLPQQQTHWIS